VNKITQDELNRQQATAEETFNDECTITFVVATTKNSVAQDKPQFAVNQGVPCGFYFRREWEQARAGIVVLDCDAVLRVALNEICDVGDYVTARGKNFAVVGTWEGSTIKTAALKNTVTMPQVIPS
jgi:hypothetical protein